VVNLALVFWSAGTAEVPADETVVRQDDYLTAELRSAVEQVKRDVRVTPTSERNIESRASLVYEWVNAYALSGGYVPVEATSLLARILAYEVPATRELDLLIAELTTLDERPEVIGTLTSEAGPFEVDKPATFTQTYVVGAAPVETGGGFLIARHFQLNSPFQVDDPGADNFVAIRSSNADVRFGVDAHPVGGMHGGFRGPQSQIVYRVTEGRLTEGDEVYITYGDTSEGGAGLLMPDFISDEMPYPIYLNLDGSDLWYSLPIQPIQVVSGPIAGVHGFVPSVVSTGETFQLTIRAEDAFGNRARGDIPGWRLSLNGKAVREIGAGQDGVVLVDGLSLENPGVYRFDVESLDGRYRSQLNPIKVSSKPGNRIYWGDTHGHSGFAEGVGTAAAYKRFARDDARLDFITHSEHDLWMDAAEWEVLRDTVMEFSEEGRFIAYLGYEWTMRHSQGGHHNVLFRTPEDRYPLPVQQYKTLSGLYQGLRERYKVEDVVTIPHAHQKGEYRLSDPELQPLVEIMSMHGTFEWFGRMYLSHGHQVGFIAASDDHIGRPGYATPRTSSLAQRGGLAAVLAPERTTDAIFDAMRNLQTYATTGDRIILDVRLNDAPMGQRIDYSEQRSIRGRVNGTAPIDSVTVVKNDEEIWQQSYRVAGPLEGNVEVTLSFFSESYPYHALDNPRGWRHWRGRVRVENAGVKDAHLVDRANYMVQHLDRVGADGDEVEFATLTRGDFSSIDLALTDAGPDTRIIVTLEDAAETGSGPPLMHPHRDIDGQKAVFRFSELQDGALTMDVGVDGYKDEIVLRAVRQDGPMDIEFNFRDDGEMRQGDYYFVRVRQANEAIAWSSPIWVGGYAPK
jgi:hypothetical protein